jgi:hypothetical protein
MILKEFDPVIYPYKVWVVIDKEPCCLSEYFSEYNGAKIVFVDSDNTHRSAAFVMPVQKMGESPYYGVVLYFRSKRCMTMEIIAHEATHAAKYLFEHIGAEIAPFEPFEYVVGWIANCCDKVRRGVEK